MANSKKEGLNARILNALTEIAKDNDAILTSFDVSHVHTPKRRFANKTPMNQTFINIKLTQLT